MEKIKVLLVDDNIDMLMIGKRIFERAGHLFLQAKSGQEGLDLAKQEKPDIIILDYILPDFNGTEFIKRLADHPEYEEIKDTPVVVLTARPNYIEDLETCFQLGLKAYLNKPFGHRELVNVVENIVRIHRLERAKGGPEEPEVEVKMSQEQTVDDEWLDDLRIAVGTIGTLCAELVSADSSNLSEEQKMDIEAIYNSYKRLHSLVNDKVRLPHLALAHEPA